MAIQTVNTIAELYIDIGKFLQDVYSQEELVNTYNDALKKAHSIRVIYSDLPDVPSHNNKPLDGLQSIRKWCEEAEKAVDDIVSNLKRQTINKVISKFKRLRGFADEVLSLVNNELKNKIQNEVKAKYEKKKSQEEDCIKAETERRLLAAQKASASTPGIISNIGSSLVIETQVIADFCKKKGFILLSKESEENKAVQSYLSKDPTFNDRWSQLDNEIFKVFEEIDKLAGSNTSDGELIDVYCKLKDIPLQQQYYEVGNSLIDLADIIFGNCNRLYSSIDNVTKTLENIQIKVATKQNKKKAIKSKDSVKKFQPWENPGDACFILKNSRIIFHYKTDDKDLKLSHTSRAYKLLYLFVAKNPLPQREIMELCTEKTRASDIVKVTNEALNKKIAAFKYSDIPKDIAFVKFDTDSRKYGLHPKIKYVDVKEVF